MYQISTSSDVLQRKREKSPHPPFGGMLCDIMGLGKTIQALGNYISFDVQQNSNTLQPISLMEI